MRPTDLVGLALSRLGTGKLRTALTMLGIIIGVASVVALVSVAEGATQGISNQLQALGTNLLTVSPGFTTTGATRGAIGSATTLTLDDANALATLDDVQTVAPELTTNKLVVAGTQNETTRLVGTTPGYLSVFAYQIWVGTFLSQASVDDNLRVAVIGATTATNLDLTSSSIGSTIDVGGLPFQLIGILQPKGGTTTADDQVVIPISTAHELFIGSDSVSAIGLSATSQDAINTVSAEITTTLDQRHGITTPARPTSPSRLRPSCSAPSAR